MYDLQLYVGIDIGKRVHTAVLKDQNGKQLGTPRTFENSNQGTDKLLQHINSIVGDTNTRIYFGLEASGIYWYSLFERLTREGYKIRAFNPIQTSRFAKTEIRKRKTDRIDAGVIADLLRYGAHESTSLCEEDVQELRNLARYRRSLSQNIGDVKRRLKSVIHLVNPEFEKYFTNTFCNVGKSLLKKCPLPKDILEMEEDDLTELLRIESRGRYGVEKAREIISRANDTFGSRRAQSSNAVRIKSMLHHIEFLEKEIAKIDRKIEAKLAKIHQHLDTITGINSVLAGIIIGEIGNISRFHGSDSIVAYSGLDPSVRQSGEYLEVRYSISKRGSKYLRYALWIAAAAAVTKEGYLRQYYLRKRKEGKHYRVAICATAAKLARIVYCILKENRPYMAEPPTRR